MTLSSLSLRPLAFGLVTLSAGFGASAALACPDWSLTGTPISYSAQDLGRPQAVGVIAGGNVDLAGCPMPGHGYVITQPDFDFSFTDNSARQDLTLRVEATCDTVLLINDATGTWHFSDDEGGNFNPAITLPGAPAGAYDIWVGTFGQSTCEAQLILSAGSGGGGAGTAPGYPPAPGNMTTYRGQVGQTLTFTVTGATSGSVWGSGVYTDDSSVAAAAVHAGVIRPGETAPVEVTVLPGQQSYNGSTQNGVQSSNYGSWSGSYSFPAAAPAAMADPGNLTSYRDRVGQTLTFLLTGSTSGSVWGSGPYTDDSSLATAAVHAGVLQPGQSGPVEVTILPGEQSYSGSAQNGVQSSNYGTWQGSYSFPAAPAVSAPAQPSAGK
ncbi:LCCL domain-containing protein [Pararhodobacter aggregans]|uniref:LCCL domain-containing protein n=1 Tax=Pararhodobacter aggregans TaxID=404875 RepID=A0A2T7UJU5_9RHOB|nr:LCCL domain-containing protein [Pararhodobacter aggregans]PTW97677.1 LCCL domain-containing protein [Pararhodobacter aggregans]PVE44951.1 hypothetical protein DDE23_24040 [Pararhodobacter aggregans]